MANHFPEELQNLYLLRLESLETGQNMSRADAESLLVRAFAHVTSPEVLALLSPLLMPATAMAAEVAAPEPVVAAVPEVEPEARIAPMAEVEPEAAPEPVVEEPAASELKASLSDPFAGLPDDDWLADQEEDDSPVAFEEPAAPLTEAPADEAVIEAPAEPEVKAQPAPTVRREMPSLAQLEEERERAQQGREALLLSRQLERIQACQDPDELIGLYQVERDAEIKEQMGARLEEIFTLRLSHLTGIDPLLALLQRIPARLPVSLRQDMLDQLSERWESYVYAEIARADGIDGLAGQLRRLVEFWELCEPLDYHPLAVERVYVELSKQWLTLAADEAELQSLELPPLYVIVNDEPRQILSQPELRQEVQIAWEALILQRLLEADSLRELRTLYHSQDWDAHYRPARKMILKSWNELTTKALAEAESFAELGAVVRNGGSPMALQRWIESAQSWDELTQVYASVDAASRNSRQFTQLVEKIMLQADSEERIREAHSLMRSHTLDWMMGNKEGSRG